MKRIICLASILLFGVSLIGCKEQITGLKTEGVLVVGMECAYAPFNWTESVKTESNVKIEDVNGYAEGYDVQIAKIIAQELNLELKIKQLSFTGLVTALQNGQIDLIIAGMSPTEERKKAISFTEGYYRSSHVLLVNKDSDLVNATKLSDFENKTVAGQLGTIYADLVPQMTNVGAIAGTNKDTVSKIVLDMKAGLTDAQILELPVAQGLVARDESLAYVVLEEGHGFEVAEEDVLVSIGIRKNFVLEERINEILQNISEERRTELMVSAVQNAEE